MVLLHQGSTHLFDIFPEREIQEGGRVCNCSYSLKGTASNVLANLTDKGKHDSMHNRLSMDPVARCKLSKLEWVREHVHLL